MNTTYVVISGANVVVPNPSVIRSLLAPYGVTLTDLQIAQVQTYIGTLVFWNQRISLTSIEDPEEIVSRHFGESFFCRTFIPVEKSRLADVGSGAGFPGLPLKILRPDAEVYLIEQDTRKAAFLNEVVRSLKLESTRVIRTHYETMGPAIGDFDIVTARATGNYKTLLKWASARLRAAGLVILLVGLEEATRLMQVRGWSWSPPVSLPQSAKRVILTATISK